MKRLISWLLALTLIFGLVPMSAMAATDVEIGGDDADVEVDFGELVGPTYIELDTVVTQGPGSTFEVTVPAGESVYYKGSARYAGLVATIDGETEIPLTRADDGFVYLTITNDTAEAKTYTVVVNYPLGSDMNPVVITDMNWYYGEVSQAAGDFDGYYYTYTATETGVVTLYFNAVYDDNGDLVENVGVRDIMVTNMNTYAQYTLQQDGVDNYGLELIVPVEAGQQLMIITSWVKDAEGNYYPEATYSWTGNFSYPAGSEQNPITIEWNWDDEYANATASVEVAADGTYFNGYAGMILTANGEEIAQENGVFVLDKGEYELALATPVGAYNNPEVIENIDGYTDTNSLAEGGSYSYIWTATEAGTVTLDVTAGANIVVDQITGISEDGWPISVQHELATVEYDESWNASWVVAENLTIEVEAGQQLKIQVQGLTDWATWTTPAIDYTLTGEFEAEAPIVLFKWAGMSVELKDSLAAKFVFPKASIIGEGNYAVIAKEVYNKTTGEITIETITVEQAEWSSYNAANYAIIFNGVAAMQMMDEFTVTVYNAKGQQISENYVRTIADYLYGRLTANIAQTMKNLAVDFLNYGSACQELFSYRPTELANAALTATQKGWATTDEAVSGIVSEQVKGSCFAGFTVAAEYEIIPSFVYQNSKIGNVAYANVSYTDFQGKAVSYDIQAADFGAYNASMTKVVINGTSVPDGASPITVTLYTADGTVVDQSVDCVNFYAVRQISKHAAYGALLKLIYSAGIAF